MSSRTHDLDDFMRAVTEQMAQEYARIQKRATEDPGTAGDQGEENWASLLREWLPSTYHIVTKGRILSHEGTASPQIDVLVLHPTYPKQLLDKKLYLAGGVAAAFECKLTLKSDHIRKAMKNSVEIKKHLPNREGSPRLELSSPIIFGVLAHSHIWQGEFSTPVDNIERYLHEADKDFVEHPRDMIDLFCVADLATWTSVKTSWVGPKMIPDWQIMEKIYGPRGAAISSYMGFSAHSQNQKESFYPVGTLLSHLLNKLAWEDVSLRRLARYFFESNVPGSGQGAMRLWDDSIYSIKTRLDVVAGKLNNGVLWDEWSIGFY